jgi:hypothetical protein
VKPWMKANFWALVYIAGIATAALVLWLLGL